MPNIIKTDEASSLNALYPYLYERISRREFIKKTARLGLGIVVPKVGGSLSKGEALSKTKERLKTPEELRVESIIEIAYQLYFRKMLIRGREFLLRIPFGQWNERFSGQNIFMGGKGDPESNWQRIEELSREPDFAEYQEALSQLGKILAFYYLPQRTYRIFSGEKEIEKIKARFRGNEMYPYETKEDSSLLEIYFYNYFYLKRVGVDCSGFSFRFPRAIALHHGVDPCEEIGQEWGVRPEKVPLYIGTWFYHNHRYAERVDDKIINLRPGDLILFPARQWEYSHSAVIQSIDLERGRVRYVQCTDWVFNREERGPHDSEIIFDPAFPQMSLSDPSLVWTQRVGPVFESETCPYGTRTDEFRYQLPPFKGKVARLRRVAEILREKEPLYYTNLLS